MPILQINRTANSNLISNTKVITSKFRVDQKADFKKVCDLMLKHNLYSPVGMFQSLWVKSEYLDTVYISYMLKDRKPIAVAFIERGYDFGYFMPAESEGFISCYVKQNYRMHGVATKLCKAVIEAGKFTEVAGQLRLQQAVLNAGIDKYHVC